MPRGLSYGVWLLCLAAFCFVEAGIAADSPNLGRSIDAHDLKAFKITVMPDGDGLPPGSGNAQEGSVLYERYCLACHGEKGQGGSNEALVGGLQTLGTSTPLKTVGSYWPYATTLFDYIRRSMPYPTPGALSTREVYSVTAYLLYLNGIVGEDEIMDATTLPRVVMPNRDGFQSAYPVQ